MTDKENIKALWQKNPVHVSVYLVWMLPSLLCWFMQGLIEGVAAGLKGRR